MLFRVALVLVSLPLLVHGGEGLYVGLSSRTLEQVSCEQFLQHGARSAWVRITGCELDYLNAGYRDASSGIWQRLMPGGGLRISELLFPLRAPGTDPAAPVRLIVSTRDPVVLAIAERTFANGEGRDQESFLVTMLQVVTAMRASREVEGTVRRPLEKLRARSSTAAIRAPLADDVDILDLHERPDMFGPAAEVLAGLVALALLLRTRRIGEEADARARVSGPRLMLLNLPPGASAADIERAPPLGSRNEVQSLIVMSLPGISFDDRGHGTFSVRAGSVEVDLRADDPVYTAVVTVRGNSSPAVARLLEETGWQAYAPKPGVFVSQSDLRPRAG